MQSQVRFNRVPAKFPGNLGAKDKSGSTGSGEGCREGSGEGCGNLWASSTGSTAFPVLGFVQMCCDFNPPNRYLLCRMHLMHRKVDSQGYPSGFIIPKPKGWQRGCSLAAPGATGSTQQGAGHLENWLCYVVAK